MKHSSNRCCPLNYIELTLSRNNWRTKGPLRFFGITSSAPLLCAGSPFSTKNKDALDPQIKGIFAFPIFSTIEHQLLLFLAGFWSYPALFLTLRLLLAERFLRVLHHVLGKFFSLLVRYRHFVQLRRLHLIFARLLGIVAHLSYTPFKLANRPYVGCDKAPVLMHACWQYILSVSKKKDRLPPAEASGSGDLQNVGLFTARGRCS